MVSLKILFLYFSSQWNNYHMSPHQDDEGIINTGIIAYRKRKMIPESNVHHISNISLGLEDQL